MQTIKMFFNHYKEVFLNNYKEVFFKSYFLWFKYFFIIMFYSFDKFFKSSPWANFLKLYKL